MDDLLDALETARIHAGAEMGKLCNQQKWIEALIFESLRDILACQLNVIKEYAVCKNVERYEGHDKQ